VKGQAVEMRLRRHGVVAGDLGSGWLDCSGLCRPWLRTGFQSEMGSHSMF
jgi:hypothetical protein